MLIGDRRKKIEQEERRKRGEREESFVWPELIFADEIDHLTFLYLKFSRWRGKKEAHTRFARSLWSLSWWPTPKLTADALPRGVQRLRRIQLYPAATYTQPSGIRSPPLIRTTRVTADPRLSDGVRVEDNRQGFPTR